VSQPAVFQSTQHVTREFRTDGAAVLKERLPKEVRIWKKNKCKLENVRWWENASAGTNKHTNIHTHAQMNRQPQKNTAFNPIYEMGLGMITNITAMTRQHSPSTCHTLHGGTEDNVYITCSWHFFVASSKNSQDSLKREYIIHWPRCIRPIKWLCNHI